MDILENSKDIPLSFYRFILAISVASPFTADKLTDI